MLSFQLYMNKNVQCQMQLKNPWHDMLPSLGQDDGFENGYGFYGPSCSKVDSILNQINHYLVDNTILVFLIPVQWIATYAEDRAIQLLNN